MGRHIDISPVLQPLMGCAQNSDVVTAIANWLPLLILVSLCASVYFCVYFCESYRSTNDETPASLVPVAHTSPDAETRGLDHDILKSLPMVVYDPKEFEEGLQCSICLSEVSEGEEVRVLPNCNHGFHLECIDMWFLGHTTCPLCRNPLTRAEKKPVDANRQESSQEVGATSSRSNSDSDSRLGSNLTTHLTEELHCPTNVIFWGDECQVWSRGEASGISYTYRQRDDFVIEIPRHLCV